jgi:hypothetical protein
MPGEAMKLLSLALSCLCLFQCRSTSESHEKFGDDFGNGTDDKTYAWFSDPDRSVSYCINISDDFGISLTEFQDTLDASLQKWVTYFNEHRTIASYLTAKKFVAQSNCSDRTDLIFYLGSNNNDATVKNLIDAHKGPSFAYLQANIGQDWGRGLMWVAAHKSMDNNFPDWRKDSNLLLMGTLLHQLGHIFGLSDIDDTIMDPDLVDIMRTHGVTDKAKAHERFKSIEWGVALARPRTFKGASSFLDPNHDSKRREILESLTGRKVAGAVTSELRFDGSKTAALILKSGNESAALEMKNLRDSFAPIAGGFHIRTKSLASIQSKIGDISADEIAFDNIPGLASDKSLGISEYTVEIKGAPKKLTLEFNQFGTPFMVYFHEDGKRYELFRSVTPYDLEGHNPSQHF